MSATLASERKNNVQLRNRLRSKKSNSLCGNVSTRQKYGFAALASFFGLFIAAIVIIAITQNSKEVVDDSSDSTRNNIVQVENGATIYGVEAESSSDGVNLVWDTHGSINTYWMVSVKPYDVDPFVVVGTSTLVKGLKPKVEYQFTITSNSGYGSLKYGSEKITYTGNSTTIIVLEASIVFDPVQVSGVLFRVGESINPEVTPIISCPKSKPTICVDTFTVTPQLPSGIVLDSTTGVISGTPIQARNFITYVVSAITTTTGNDARIVKATIVFDVANEYEPTQPTTPCDGTPCKNGGACEITKVEPSSFKCDCDNGWSGEDCSIREDICANTNPCANGKCINTVSEELFRCECDAGWIGDTCDDVQPVCDRTVCSNNSVCKEVDGEGVCECPLGASGPDCRTFDTKCGALNCSRLSPTFSTTFGYPSCSCDYDVTLSHIWTPRTIITDTENLDFKTTPTDNTLVISSTSAISSGSMYAIRVGKLFEVTSSEEYVVDISLSMSDRIESIQRIRAIFMGSDIPDTITDINSLTPLGYSDLTLGSSNSSSWSGAISVTGNGEVRFALEITFISGDNTDEVIVDDELLRIGSITIHEKLTTN